MTRNEFLGTYCNPVTGPIPVPGGTVQVYECPPPLLPFVPPLPEDFELPEIDLPGILNPGGTDEPNITDDPEEGITVGPVIQPEQAPTVPQPEAGELAGENEQPPLPPADFPSPHPEVRETVRERARENECVEGCKECPPIAEARYDWNTYRSAGVDESNAQNYEWAEYQSYVCGLPNDPTNGRIIEVYYLSYETSTGPRPYPWDGFEPFSCTMVEAKHRYDTHLTHIYISVTGSDGEPDPRRRTVADPDRPFLAEVEFAGLIEKAEQQANRLAGVEDVGLIWAFSSFDSQDYFFWQGGRNIGNPPRFTSFHLPWER